MRTIWILIANASEARLFKAEKNPKDMELIREFYHPESREKVSNLVAGGLGRYRKSSSTPKSAFEEQTNPKQVEMERFAHHLAEQLDEGRVNHLYKDLIVVAPPHFHGLLNKFCNDHVRNLIKVTLEKDYTKLKKEKLWHYLDGKVRPQAVA